MFQHIRKYSIFYLAVLLLSGLYIIFIPRCIFNDSYCTVITDRSGDLLGARVSDDGQWRFPPGDSIPEKIVKATLAFEDRYFYYHPGINPYAILRALWLNLKTGHVVSGGSTITMQTIRLLRHDKPRNIKEKLLEMIMATRLELSKTKYEILSMYTSHAPYGGNVIGVEAASWRYFGISSSKLSWAEAATLAVLPNSPALIHPGRNRNLLLRKRNRLLNKLNKIGWIDNATLKVSLFETIPERPNPMPVVAPHLLNRVFAEQKGRMVHTTIDKSMQMAVAELVNKHYLIQKNNEVHNAAAIIIDVETGSILAYAGNCGYPFERSHSNDVDIIVSQRSTGSLLKPLLYAAMLEDGKILPESLVEDIPVNLTGFSPKNFDGQFEGVVPASRALSRSLNIPAVQLLKNYGVERFQHLLRDLGMKSVNKPSGYYGLSLILGGAEGNLEEMTNVYACLSRVLKHYNESGKYFKNDVRPACFDKTQISTKQSGEDQPAVFYASSVWYTYQAMLVVNRPEEERGWQYFGSSRKIAWKTGTSFGYRDGWAIGTTTQYAVGVWFGNADGEGRPGLTGIATAAPLLFDIVGLLPGSKWFDPPLDEMIAAPVCHNSGFLAGQYCQEKDTVKIPFTGLKSPVCPYHKLVHLSNDKSCQVTSDCYPVDRMNHLSWFVLPPVHQWYYRKRHTDYKTLPPFSAACSQNAVRSMDMVYPREQVKVFIPRELSGEKGRVVFEAVHNRQDALIFWHLDDKYIGCTKYIHQMEFLPAAGKHKMVLVDENGEELIRNFEAVEP